MSDKSPRLGDIGDPRYRSARTGRPSFGVNLLSRYGALHRTGQIEDGVRAQNRLGIGALKHVVDIDLAAASDTGIGGNRKHQTCESGDRSNNIAP